MPDQFRINVQTDAEVIRSRSRGKHPIVCPISVSLGNRYYPHESRDDFALTILESWHQQVADIRRGNTRQVNLLFMDGPFMIRLVPLSAELWTVVCVRRGRGNIVEITGECDPDQVEYEITDALKQILSGVKQAGLWSDGCSELELRLAGTR
jgi:hypothetical protein